MNYALYYASGFRMLFEDTMAKQLDALKKKRDAINSRIRLVQNRELRQKRKDDTRRKILVGSYFLDKTKKDGSFEELSAKLDKFLVRDSDRKLFDLPYLNETEK